MHLGRSNRPITSQHLLLHLLGGMNTRKKSRVCIYFKTCDIFGCSVEVEMKDGFLKLPFIAAFLCDHIHWFRHIFNSSRCCPTQRVRFHLQYPEGSRQANCTFYWRKSYFLNFRVSHPIAPLTVCALLSIKVCVISSSNTSKHVAFKVKLCFIRRALHCSAYLLKIPTLLHFTICRTWERSSRKK